MARLGETGPVYKLKYKEVNKFDLYIVVIEENFLYH